NRFPNTVLGVIVAKGIDNTGKNDEVTRLLQEVEAETIKRFDGKPISEDPTIQSWRQAYRSFGARDYCASIEALVKRMVKGKGVWQINKLVDLYNYISLKYVLPVGGEDINKIEGNLILKEAEGDERFIALGSEENDPPLSGEPIYRDDHDVICRRWNWREAEKTKLTEETRDAILVIEGLQPEERARIESALQEFATLIEKYLGGKLTTYQMNIDNRATTGILL
ncbi:hypothetical protein KGQ71_03980, partial [Patescibacteria group bacterium]|nr:hypothetical protein [Patescibacteria group bacterium]